MAVFQEKNNQKCLDETVPFTCTIVNYKFPDGYVQYIIKVYRGIDEKSCWTITRRYREFVTLHQDLHATQFGIQLPPKKFLGNLNRKFIAQRQAQLQKYLDSILGIHCLAFCSVLKKFLDPDNYSPEDETLAQRNAAMALRGKAEFTDTRLLAGIGWRFRKQYFTVKNRKDSKDCVLSWIQYGPYNNLAVQELHTIMLSVADIVHPFISNVIASSCCNSGALVIRPICFNGSLRDVIYDRSLHDTFPKKCYPMREKQGLPTQTILMWSVEILYALKYLHEKGFPFCNLHSGNVLIENGAVKLTDVENGFLGLPSYFRPCLLSNRRIRSCEDIDVYCFGQVLYEMTFGEVLNSTFCTNVPMECDLAIKPILEMLLSPNFSKEYMPKISVLLRHPTFHKSCKEISQVVNACPKKFKLSVSNRELLRKIKIKIEQNLQEEQCRLWKHKRITLAQEIMNAEEDEMYNNSSHKTKRKTRMRKVSSQSSVGNSASTEACGSDSLASVGTSTSNIMDSQSIPTSNSTSPPPPPLPPPLPEVVSTGPSDPRSELFQAILNFNKSHLKKK